jgi:hypothetical protein
VPTRLGTLTPRCGESCAARFRAAATWDCGPVQSPAGLGLARSFVDQLVERGTIVMGGPFSDHSGAMLLLEGVSTEEARRVFDLDPFVKNQVFVVDDTRDWTIFVDSPTAPEAGAQP